ncbi:YkuS family protein [Viridibacillus arvi]|uniref:YkuS family protein n=1 Tax=Viridibacillus arvi TaxID=263475 RepID=UPI003D016E2C
MSIIGVEQSLTNVSEALLAKGYEIVELKHESDVTGVDCCVITGLDNNALGIHDTSIQGSIIEAAGLSADEVCRKVEEKLNLH